MRAECVAHVLRKAEGTDDLAVMESLAELAQCAAIARTAAQWVHEVMEPHHADRATAMAAQLVAAYSALEDQASAMFCGYAHKPADHGQEDQ